VFFFPDLCRVLSEMHRVLLPGGIVGFAFERGHDPRWGWYEQLLRDNGLLEGLPPMPGNDLARTAGHLSGVLKRVGFVDVQEQTEGVELYYASAETWWESLWTHGSRRPLERLTAEQAADVRRVCVERATLLEGPQGVPELHRFVFVVGCRRA
jgi:hypothetical protein